MNLVINTNGIQLLNECINTLRTREEENVPILEFYSVYNIGVNNSLPSELHILRPA